jgi:uncharacterized membrane protein YhiD involved in acid resistance
MQDFLDLLRSGQTSTQTTGVTAILLSLAVAAALSLPIALIYMKTRSKEGYTQSFVQALILISIVVAAIMLIIGNNIARAFGLIGAVAIIRFRTRLRDPRDTTFLFLCIAIGMTCGLRLYHIGVVTTAFISCILLILWKIDFAGRRVSERDGILRIKLRDMNVGRGLLTECLEEGVAKWEIIGISSDKEEVTTVEYGIWLEKGITPDRLIHRLRKSGPGNFISIDYHTPK